MKTKKKAEHKAFFNKSRAVRKLQLPLGEFRRLCILKGVYPRMAGKNKGLGPNAAMRTWFSRKDVLALMHEPLVSKVRESKTFERKVKRHSAKEEWSVVESLEKRRPEINIDHVIKERYLTFSDALADIDDALSTVILFGRLSAPNEKFSPYFLDECRMLGKYFHQYVAEQRCIVKSFVSFKGIYLQAVVHSSTITWIIPHPLVVDTPEDIKYDVLHTFLTLYERLVQFVLLKMYSMANKVYPPVSTEFQTSPSDEFVTPQLFSNFVFFVGRECNVEVLSMLIYSMGGKVVQDDKDSRITHHVYDRPHSHLVRIGDRVYVQPQWAFDCLNAGKLLMITGSGDDLGYAPGDTLPPHLSPFVDRKNKEVYHPDQDMENVVVGEEDREHVKMAKMLMSRKNKGLYNRHIRVQKKKSTRMQRLIERKKKLKAPVSSD